MRGVFLGPPGVGKGTQAKTFCEKRKIAHVSTGELLRRAVREGTPLGQKASGIMARGELVPDALVLEIVAERLRADDCRKGGFILDGYPRNLAQAKDLDKTLKGLGLDLQAVVAFEVDRAALIERLSGRRECSKCQAGYHVKSQPPKKPGACDKCGGALVQREDDQPASIEKRLQVYEAQTKELIGYYGGRKLLVPVSAEGEIAAVSKRTEDALRRFP